MLASHRSQSHLRCMLQTSTDDVSLGRDSLPPSSFLLPPSPSVSSNICRQRLSLTNKSINGLPTTEGEETSSCFMRRSGGGDDAGGGGGGGEGGKGFVAGLGDSSTGRLKFSIAAAPVEVLIRPLWLPSFIDNKLGDMIGWRHFHPGLVKTICHQPPPASICRLHGIVRPLLPRPTGSAGNTHAPIDNLRPPASTETRLCRVNYFSVVTPELVFAIGCSVVSVCVCVCVRDLYEP